MTLEATHRPAFTNPSSAKAMQNAYGFDEVAIVPGAFTVNPDLTDTSLTLGDFVFQIPILAAATDAVVNPDFAGKLGHLGGLAVLNLEGIHTRYEDTSAIFEEIAEASKTKVTSLLQDYYTPPIDDRSNQQAGSPDEEPRHRCGRVLYADERQEIRADCS